MMAQQTHTAFLNSEVERLEKERTILQSSQSASSQDWKSEVSEYRKAYQHIKRKYEVICTKVRRLPRSPAGMAPSDVVLSSA